MIIKEADRLSSVSTYYFATKLKQVAQMNQDGGSPVINLGIGSPDLNPPRGAVERLISSSSDEGVNKYQSYAGIPKLRQAFSGWYGRHFSVQMDADSEILPLIGSKEGIMHISMAFLNPGDEVLVPNPGYPAYSAVSKLCGATVVEYALKEEHAWLPDLDALSSQNLDKVKIMWLNYPHMPTGARASTAFFKEVVSFAREHNILLCHDNPYTFILNQDPMSIFQVEGAREVCLELTSLSKNYNMAGWRVGAVAGGKEYLQTILKFKSNMDSGMYRGLQEAAVEALSQGEAWHDRLNSIYEKRKKVALEIMDILGCTYDADSVGLFIWGRVPFFIEEAESLTERLLLGSRVFITPGHIFGDQGSKYIRISLCATIDQLEQAKGRIVETLKSTEV